MKNEAILQAIMDYIVNERKRLAPEVTDDALMDGGAIYYMNGNDGTEFDFFANGRTCEFEQFYKSTELGCIKAYLTDTGVLSGYLWKDEGKARGVELDEKQLTDPETAEAFAWYLENEFDGNGIYDAEV